MMITKIFTAFMAIIAISSVSAHIINVPGDRPTIWTGITACVNGDTVLVQPGVYIENINFLARDIVVASLFLTTGDTSYISSTIIDGNFSGSVVTFDCGEDSPAMITGFTITNGLATKGGGIFCENSGPSIEYNVITGNYAEYGGGIECRAGANAKISNNVIKENAALGVYGSGGGIFCIQSSPAISNNVIMENHSSWRGGGLHFRPHSGGSIRNNTICHNSAGTDGGGIFCEHAANPNIINTIFWENCAAELGNEIFIQDDSLTFFSYCNIQDGWVGEGNIDIDPMFVDLSLNDFYLLEYSPCIDAGNPESPFDPDGSPADIGAFYYHQIPNSVYGYESVPEKYWLFNNYPNPFNDQTIIKYSLPKPGIVTIEIYDLLGRKVETLVNAEQQAGYHQLTWITKNISSGTYFCRLEASDYGNIIKMMLLR
ncbi:MAG: T9SS type A sorting domain-containing protein [candidate division Zixibacteria bacterium]|nr:T9SS type A sorting domain-containing protein [candidate division Zixibacteria bacterium]